MSMRVLHRSAWLIFGSSQVGKSVWLTRYLRNLPSLYGPELKFKSIVWFYGSKNSLQGIPSDVRKKITHFVQGIPDNLEEFCVPKPAIYIFDDLCSEAFNNPEILNLFIRGVHHDDITILVTSQANFLRERYARLCSLNCQYIVQFPSPRDAGQFAYLARQVLPDQWRDLVSAYSEHTATPYQPFLLDLHPSCPTPWARFRGNILPDEECSVVYCPNKYLKDVPQHVDSFEEK